eukprot:CAMPEP_0197539506 /NCGR_PEP_ID=MMETSP1318-20131121/62967_1 /TAXON_ID=552666 /ORGANISM="Partenskyella glossopodia, Strain RCC365" /LENGTH=122 /DNA_ID=CAMNT_0043098243 /DNA_START=34 /DNA_END=399 /DNA_ORIENTATION=-
MEEKELPIIDIRMAMSQVDDDYEFLIELLQDFLEDIAKKEFEKENYDKEIQELYAAKEKAEDTVIVLRKISKRAHAVKGSAMNLGLSRVARDATLLEAMCNSYADAPSKLDKDFSNNDAGLR